MFFGSIFSVIVYNSKIVCKLTLQISELNTVHSLKNKCGRNPSKLQIFGGYTFS